ncbi:MAG: enoyl-CoA hydratase [Alphaproteobacteria bacterium]|nr:enoyl-CoA hydratase [Alphaproteobacteria bacterium]
MNYETLKISRDGAIVTLTLNRPDCLNAFTVQMARELIVAFDELDADDAVRAVIVTGAGRAFCAGMDLSGEGNVFGLDENVDPYGPDAQRIRDTGGEVVLRIYRMNKPVIAAINGVAVGVGATMTLAMDARILSNEAKIGFVFSKIGISLESCASWFLPRLVGIETALDWTLSAEIIEAQAAHAAGLARAVVSGGELLQAARSVAQRFTAATSPVSVAVNRQLLWRMAGATHPMEAHKVETRTMFDLSQADGREGVNAFKEGRNPEFGTAIRQRMPRGLDWDGEPDFA